MRRRTAGSPSTSTTTRGGCSSRVGARWPRTTSSSTRPCLALALGEGRHDRQPRAAEWLCARVYATLGHPEPALRHAGRCLDLVEAGGEGFEEWDRAAALEAVARARLEAGDLPGARNACALATNALTAITDPDDRAQIAAELDGLAGLLDRA